MRKNENLIRLIGIFLMILGLLANPWFIEKLFSQHEKISHLSTLAIILIFDAASLICGAIFIFFSKQSIFFIKRNKLNLLLSFISIFLAFITLILLDLIILGEGYIQEHDSGNSHATRFDPYLGWSPIPSRETILFGDKMIMFSTNSEGFRSEELNSSKEHILVLGDSVVWGSGVSDNETMPYYLESYISKKSKDYQVLNLGVSGYGIDQSYLRLIDKINITNPKIIIFVICSKNDYPPISSEISCGKSKPLLVLEQDSLRVANLPLSKYSCANILSRLDFFPSRLNAIAFLKDRALSNFCSKSKDYASNDKIIKMLFKRFSYLSKEKNATFILVVSPSRGDYINHSWELSYFQNISQAYNHIDYYGFVKSLNLKDTSNLYLRGDTVHYNPRGNKLLAKTLYDYMVNNSLIQ